MTENALRFNEHPLNLRVLCLDFRFQPGNRLFNIAKIYRQGTSSKRVNPPVTIFSLLVQSAITYPIAGMSCNGGRKRQ